MRKQNSISFETSRAFFDAKSEAEAGGSFFIVRGGPEPIRIDVPTSVMHRLFRLGQAYGLRQLRYLESDAKFLVGQVEIPEFVEDLKKLILLINDEVLHDVIKPLVSAIEADGGSSRKHVTISSGRYFEKRA